MTGPSEGKMTRPFAKSAFTWGIVSVWYASNIIVIILNKQLLTGYGFRHPFLLTLLHMLSCTFFSVVLAQTKAFPVQTLSSRRQFYKISFLAMVFVTSILLGNISLRYIPVSFNQAIGATTPFWTAVIAFLLQGMREHHYTYAALIPVVLGIVVASNGEPSFHMFGFVTCVLACVARATKSVIQAILLSEPSEKMGSLSLLMYMAPVACVVLIPATIVMEPTSFAHMMELLQDNPSFSITLASNCLIAYFVNLFNFLVTKYTSALTLQVLGNAKGAVAATVSVLIFKNAVTTQGCMGFVISIIGCVIYSECKKKFGTISQEEQNTAQFEASAGKDPESQPLKEPVSGNGSVRRTVHS